MNEHTMGLSARRRLALLSGGAVLALAMAMPVSAVAQDAAPAEAAANAPVENVTVTGTRIRQRDFTTSSPIATVGAQDIQLTGTINVEELINSLPQVVPGVTITSNNPSLNGFATADLRGFGPGRTLVLVNGRRANPSDRSGAVDLNTIPSSLIERVEIITGGASAVYGADAVAGAINFILKKDFEGIETNVSYGQAEDGAAPEWNFNATIGTPFAEGRGNITGHINYYSRQRVGANERFWSRNARAVYLDPAGNTVVVDPGFVPPAGWSLFNPGGSGTSPWASVTGGFSIANINAVYGLNGGNPLGLDADCNPANGIQSTGGTIRFDPVTGFAPFQGCGVPSTSAQAAPAGNGDRYDFSPDNFLILENERVNTAFCSEYDILSGDRLTAFIEFTFTNSRSQQQLAATPVTGLTVRVDLDPAVGTTVVNPYITANAPLLQLLNTQFAGNLDNRTLSMSIRPNQGGFRVGTAETNAYGFTYGLRGLIPDLGWDWEISHAYARNTTTISADNNVGATAMRQLINACGVTTLAAQPQPLLTLPNCPFPNRTGAGPAPFVPTITTNNPLGLNSMNADQLAFINVDTTDVTIYERNLVQGFITGDLWDLWGAGAIGAAFGFEYRAEELISRADPFKAAGDIFGFNAQESIAGEYDVYEIYGEVQIPLLSDLFLVDYLGLEGGYRLSEYSTGAGTTKTFKYGVTYSMFDWLTFRGIYNRAVRAPTAFELFQGGDQNFPGYGDPCNQTAINALPAGDQPARIATCTAWFAAGGAVWAPGFAQVNSQVQSFQIGTPTLQPEVADTLTYGVVFNPDWWPVGRLGLSVDYYKLELGGAIALRSIPNILNGCVTQLGVGPDCLLSPRDGSGQIARVDQTRSNQSNIRTEGIDVNARWAWDLEEDLGLPGTFGLAILYSWTDTFKASTTAIATAADAVNTHDGTIGGGLPEHRVATSISYSWEDLSVLVRWTHSSEMQQASYGTETVAAYDLWSLGVSYDIMENVGLTFAVDNVFDEQPQMFTDAQIFGQFNVDGSSQDQLGRAYRIGLTWRN